MSKLIIRGETNSRLLGSIVSKGSYQEDFLSALSLCPSHVASIIAKIISKSNELSLENFSEKYILDNEWIIIFQFE